MKQIMKFEYRKSRRGTRFGRDREARVRRLSNGVKVVAYAWLVIGGRRQAGRQASKQGEETELSNSTRVQAAVQERLTVDFKVLGYKGVQ